MALNELANKLKEMYQNAPNGDTVAMVHLFGIKFSDEINQSPFSKKEIAIAAGISQTYATEINKGVKLSKYVKLRNQY